MRYLLLALLAGCASTVKHETTALQCLGFCAFTNVNHEGNQNEETVPRSTDPVRQ